MNQRKRRGNVKNSYIHSTKKKKKIKDKFPVKKKKNENTAKPKCDSLLPLPTF